MKIRCALIAVVSLAFVMNGCSSSKSKVADEKEIVIENGSDSDAEKDSSKIKVNHSSLNEDDVGEVVEVNGLLRKHGEGIWSIKENPKSKSCVTFQLTDSEKVLDSLELSDGEAIHVCLELKLTVCSSMWVKEAEVVRVVSVKEKYNGFF